MLIYFVLLREPYLHSNQTQPYASNDHTIENSASFVSQLEQFNNTDSLSMSSFDISNLFTNIPIHESINILINLMYSNGVISFFGFI